MQEESVILDATYRDGEERTRLIDLAREAGADIHFILCTCPEDEIKRRLGKRVEAEAQAQVSDGRWEIYLQQKKDFAPTTDLDQDHLLVLDTNRPITEILAQLDVTVYYSSRPAIAFFQGFRSSLMHKIRALCLLIRTETLQKASAGRGHGRLQQEEV